MRKNHHDDDHHSGGGYDDHQQKKYYNHDEIDFELLLANKLKLPDKISAVAFFDVPNMRNEVILYL
jgi:hypothetical protein